MCYWQMNKWRNTTPNLEFCGFKSVSGLNPPTDCPSELSHKWLLTSSSMKFRCKKIALFAALATQKSIAFTAMSVFIQLEKELNLDWGLLSKLLGFKQK